MASLNKSTFFKSFLSYLPIIFLFFSVFNEFDFNYLKLDYFYFYFNFFLDLKKSRSLGIFFNFFSRNY
jgi:hypothetical protein